MLIRALLLGKFGELVRAAEQSDSPVCKQLVCEMKPLLEKIRTARTQRELFALNCDILALAARADTALKETHKVERESSN